MTIRALNKKNKQPNKPQKLKTTKNKSKQTKNKRQPKYTNSTCTFTPEEKKSKKYLKIVDRKK